MKPLDRAILTIELAGLFDRLKVIKISEVLPALFKVLQEERHGSQLSITDKNRPELSRTSDERSNRN